MTNDYEYTLSKLSQSPFRARFKLRPKDKEYVRAKGMETIRKHAEDFIIKRLSPAFPENDGKQTPMKNHPVFIAQHATATCCRGCMLKWHKIPKGVALDEKEVQFAVNLIMSWIEKEMTNL